MNPDIDTQLRDYADHVRSMISVIEVDEILDQPSEVEPDHRLMALRRDRKRPRWGVAVAAAALVLLVVGGLSLIVSGLSDDSTPTGDSDGLPLGRSTSVISHRSELLMKLHRFPPMMTRRTLNWL